MSTKVKWIGPVGDRGGYPQASRTYVQALHAAGVEVTVQRITFDEPNPTGHAHMDDLLRALTNRDLNYDVLFVHCVPDLWPRLVQDKIQKESARRGDETWRPKAIIGVTIWETDSIHARWGHAIEEAAVDELWLPNQFNVDTFATHSETPAFIVPHAHDLDFYARPGAGPMDLTPWGVTPDVFVFGAGFTWSPRKNPEGLLRAFCAEFSNADNVCLLLKTYSGPSRDGGYAEIEQKVADVLQGTGLRDAPAIIILPQMLPYDALLELYRRIDVGVYPYRGEGWGLHVSESMLVGTPCIVTGWSGPADFVENGVSGWHIPYQLQPVYGMPRFYDVRQNWAEADLLALRNWMRWCAGHRDEVQQAGAAAAHAIQSQYGLDDVGKLMRTRLEEMLG